MILPLLAALRPGRSGHGCAYPLSLLNSGREERGSVGGIEGLAFGVLVFLIGTLVITEAWVILDSKMATGAAAREASRVYAEASDTASAEATAEETASRVLRGHGRRLDDFDIAAGAGGALGRCVPIRIMVGTRIPRINIPLLHRAAGSSVVRATHQEIVDPYRSGLAGTARCEITRF